MCILYIISLLCNIILFLKIRPKISDFNKFYNDYIPKIFCFLPKRKRSVQYCDKNFDRLSVSVRPSDHIWYHLYTKYSRKVLLSPKGFPIGAYWYPHWENRVSIRIKVSPIRGNIIDTVSSTASGVIVTPRVSLIGGAYWYPHWANKVSIGIQISPNQDSIVDIDPVSGFMEKVNARINLRNWCLGHKQVKIRISGLETCWF